MDQKKLQELRDYYDNADTSAEIADAEFDDEVTPAPMVGITVRLPVETLQKVRERAARGNVKTTALIRHWIEQRVEAASLFSGPSPVSLNFGEAVTEFQQTFVSLHAEAPIEAEANAFESLWFRNYRVGA